VAVASFRFLAAERSLGTAVRVIFRRPRLNTSLNCDVCDAPLATLFCMHAIDTCRHLLYVKGDHKVSKLSLKGDKNVTVLSEISSICMSVHPCRQTRHFRAGSTCRQKREATSPAYFFAQAGLERRPFVRYHIQECCQNQFYFFKSFNCGLCGA